jgi:hypothetical protein
MRTFLKENWYKLMIGTSMMMASIGIIIFAVNYGDSNNSATINEEEVINVDNEEEVIETVTSKYQPSDTLEYLFYRLNTPKTDQADYSYMDTPFRCYFVGRENSDIVYFYRFDKSNWNIEIKKIRFLPGKVWPKDWSNQLSSSGWTVVNRLNDPIDYTSSTNYPKIGSYYYIGCGSGIYRTSSSNPNQSRHWEKVL